ncbi:MAG: hypothetical protein ACREKH_09295 [Candidatus Rokuibacteriota bacterium]
MTVRIIEDERGPPRIIRVEGRLTGREVSELEGALGNDLGQVELRLGNLRSADAAGIAALRRLRAAGVILRETPASLDFEIANEDR